MTYSAEQREEFYALIDLWADLKRESLDAQSLVKIIGRNLAECLDEILSKLYFKIHYLSNFPPDIDTKDCVQELINAVNERGMDYITSLDSGKSPLILGG